jgi:antitoxin (DNA-binding transcriptional repressor) of toxin-antitoxin stability system
MKKLKLSEATASLAEYAQALDQGPLILTVRGKPVAALVPITGADMETLCVGTSPHFRDIIERSRRSHETDGGISSDEIRRHFEISTVPPDFKPKSVNRKRKVSSKPKPKRSLER